MIRPSRKRQRLVMWQTIQPFRRRMRCRRSVSPMTPNPTQNDPIRLTDPYFPIGVTNHESRLPRFNASRFDDLVRFRTISDFYENWTPQPQQLPQGRLVTVPNHTVAFRARGCSCSAVFARLAHGERLLQPWTYDRPQLLPLPKGEGWGEGEGCVQMRPT